MLHQMFRRLLDERLGVRSDTSMVEIHGVCRVLVGSRVEQSMCKYP